MKQLFADVLNQAAYLISKHTPDAWWWADKPNCVVRFANYLSDWADCFDLRLRNQLRAALADTQVSRTLGETE